jgi:hypothetical protein
VDIRRNRGPSRPQPHALTPPAAASSHAPAATLAKPRACRFGTPCRHSAVVRCHIRRPDFSSVCCPLPSEACRRAFLQGGVEGNGAAATAACLRATRRGRTRHKRAARPSYTARRNSASSTYLWEHNEDITTAALAVTRKPSATCSATAAMRGAASLSGSTEPQAMHGPTASDVITAPAVCTPAPRQCFGRQRHSVQTHRWSFVGQRRCR